MEPERKPLVYATARATAQAARLLPGGAVLENVVTETIRHGGIVYRDRARDVAIVRGAGWVATARRVTSRLGTGRKAWEVVEVVPDVRTAAA